jgi:sulfatase maturation enzyme AslB (radical SAM superfamily)
MELSEFTMIITSDCDSRCSYCPQIKEKKYINNSLLEKAIEFFYPFFKDGIVVSFYGGEPLLALPRIQHTVTLINEKNNKIYKKIQYNITTNGNLMDEDILEFFNSQGFSVMVSFDGLAHEKSRQQGGFKRTVSLIKDMLKCPDISLATNSVFIPETVEYLSQSLQFIVEQGVENSHFSPSIIEPWSRRELIQYTDQLHSLRKFLFDWYKQNNTIPVLNFRRGEKTRMFGCWGGRDRMALNHDGSVWGCYRLPDYFRGKEDTVEYSDLFFGHLDYFIENYDMVYPKTLSNYSSFRQDFFFTARQSCYMCPEVDDCSTCPASAASAVGMKMLGEISVWQCELQRIQRKVVNEFYQQLEQ